MKHILYVLLAISILGTWQTNYSHAAFPDDFSDVTWLDPNVSGWAQTATITVDVNATQILVNDTKRSVWPVRFHTTLGNSCCNRSLWVFIKHQDRWYASTFEYMRFGQIGKNILALEGGHIKRPPFLSGQFDWEPAAGEVYGFMTSGMARFNLNNVNIQERSNVALYRWGEGPTDNINFDEVARNAQGKPISDIVEEPPTDEEEVCVEPPAPQPEVNTHQYSGTASGTIVVTGNTNQTASLDLPVTISVSDDRSMMFTIDDESFTSQVNNDGSFNGKFTFDIGNLGVCIVDIDVNGIINGTSASGTGSGNDACAGNTATLNATFTATSATAPSYLDEREPLPTPRPVCGSKPHTGAILQLLLDDD